MPAPADPRRALPAVFAVLAEPALVPALTRHGHDVVRDAVRSALAARRAEDGTRDTSAPAVAADALARVGRGIGPTVVLNATGVLVHTGLGRAPLSAHAREALGAAAGHTAVELSLATGRRGPRGGDVLDRLRDAVPGAEAAHVVGNGAAALLLTVTALAAGREVVVSRGQLVEIGDGFRLPDLLVTTGARLREVGTTNRTTVADYVDALGPATGAVLVVHPSNFTVQGFGGTPDPGAVAAAVRERAPGVPVVVDTGSGLLRREPALPDEPDASSTLRAGADLVTCSGDKLLGGPQAGLVLGRTDLVTRIRRHALARALRVDKLTLAALGAVLAHPDSVPVTRALRITPERARVVAEELRDAVGHGEVVAHDGVVGGGGAPGVTLPGYALALPGDLAAALRAGDPPVLARVAGGRTLVDPRCVEAEDRPALARAVRSALSGAAPGDPG